MENITFISTEESMSINQVPLAAREVAQLLRCSPGYVYRLARSGKLGYLALGEEGPGHRTAMRFPVEEVEAFVRSRLVPARSRRAVQQVGRTQRKAAVASAARFESRSSCEPVGVSS